MSPVLRAFAEQCYQNWNCQIVATAELRTHIEHVIAHMAVANRFRFIDPHNALLTSDATVANSSDWAVICNNEVIPTPEALAEIALAILANPKLKLVYGDEDRLDSAGKRTEPFFKPDWSPDFFRGRNYLGGFVAVEYNAAVKAERNLATCNLYDLVLKLIESCPSTSFHHIPKILHHVPQHHDIGGTMYAPFGTFSTGTLRSNLPAWSSHSHSRNALSTSCFHYTQNSAPRYSDHSHEGSCGPFAQMH